MRICIFALALAGVSSAEAEWLVLRDGQRSEVRSIELAGGSVRVVTLAGKTWLLLADVVDLDATKRANELPSENEGAEPSRPPPPPPPQPPPPPPPQPPPPRRTLASEPASPSVPLPPSPATPAPRQALPEPTPPPEPGPAVPARTSASGHRFAFFLNGVAGTTRLHLFESQHFDLFREEASLESLYRGREPRGYEIGALLLVKGPLGVVASAELFDNPREASFVASLPHPFFYDRAREIAGSLDLSHVERALHIGPVLTLSLGNRVSVDLFGGPSLFSTRSEILTDVHYEEVFPFNDVVPTGTVVEIFEGRRFGYHMGASTSFRLVGIFGLDLVARYSRASIRLEPGPERELTFDAGGLRLGAGIRLLIP